MEKEKIQLKEEKLIEIEYVHGYGTCVARLLRTGELIERNSLYELLHELALRERKGILH